MTKQALQKSMVLDLSDLNASIREQQKNPRTPKLGEGKAVQHGKGGEVLRYSYKIESSGIHPQIHLHYAVMERGQIRPVEEVITLRSNQPGFGGARWWLTCPECNQRRARLYLAPDTSVFACKECHDLR